MGKEKYATDTPGCRNAGQVGAVLNTPRREDYLCGVRYFLPMSILVMSMARINRAAEPRIAGT
jgi:hypothetical protein